MEKCNHFSKIKNLENFCKNLQCESLVHLQVSWAQFYLGPLQCSGVRGLRRDCVRVNGATNSVAAAADNRCTYIILKWREIEEVSGGDGAQQMRSHYSAGPAIAAGVAAAGPTHKYIDIIPVAPASKGQNRCRYITPESEWGVWSCTGGESGKVDAPLFFSLSDSGRLRRQRYLHLLCREVEGGGAPGQGGGEAAAPDWWRLHFCPWRDENQQLRLLPCTAHARVPGESVHNKDNADSFIFVWFAVSHKKTKADEVCQGGCRKLEIVQIQT